MRTNVWYKYVGPDSKNVKTGTQLLVLGLAEEYSAYVRAFGSTDTFHVSRKDLEEISVIPTSADESAGWIH